MRHPGGRHKAGGLAGILRPLHYAVETSRRIQGGFAIIVGHRRVHTRCLLVGLHAAEQCGRGTAGIGNEFVCRVGLKTYVDFFKVKESRYTCLVPYIKLMWNYLNRIKATILRHHNMLTVFQVYPAKTLDCTEVEWKFMIIYVPALEGTMLYTAYKSLQI